MFQKITSRDNQKLKRARKVRDGKIKNSIFIEGVRHCEEVLRSKAKVEDCFFSENFIKNLRGRELIESLSKQNMNIAEIEEAVFQTIADTKTSQGIILIVEKPDTTKENFDAKTQEISLNYPLLIYLSEINNPSNLGAILRTIEAVGASGVIISENSTDAFSPKAARSAIGANLRLPIWENASLNEVLIWAKQKNLTTAAADISAENSYTQIDWTAPRLLIFGSEAHGLSEEDLEEIKEKIYIPMENGVESLNLAVSCGIILYEAKRQNDGRKE